MTAEILPSPSVPEAVPSTGWVHIKDKHEFCMYNLGMLVSLRILMLDAFLFYLFIYCFILHIFILFLTKIFSRQCLF